MTDPEINSVRQTPDELRAFVGQQVHVFRDNAQEGTGELIEVIAGELPFYNEETQQVEHPIVEDKTLHWADVSQGDQVASRRRGNAWRLVPVTP